MGNTILLWLIGVLFALFAVFIFMAGVKLVTSGGNPEAKSAAKASFTNALIGILIVLAAWIMIDTVMKGLVVGDGDLSVVGGTGFGPWNQIQCVDQPVPTVVYEDVQGPLPYDASNPRDAVLPSPGGNCPVGYTMDAFGTCIRDASASSGPVLPDAGGNCPAGYTMDAFGSCVFESGFTSSASPTGSLTTYAGYQFDSGIVNNVQYIADTFNLRVSSGYRDPDRNRRVGGSPTSYHLTGRAADFVGTSADMNAAAAYARANGAREVLIHNAGSGVHLHIGW